LSLWLKYRITEVSFRPEIADSVRKVYGVEIGKSYLYRVLALFKSRDFWIGPLPMVYDTGAAVSLLPFRFFEILHVEKFAPVKLTGVVSEMEIPARLTRLTLKFMDVNGVESPEVEAWIAIAEREDVPLIVGLKSIAETHNFKVNFRNKTFTLDFY
jgi:hypothetical protein